jgi:hypothetical protein
MQWLASIMPAASSWQFPEYGPRPGESFKHYLDRAPIRGEIPIGPGEFLGALRAFSALGRANEIANSMGATNRWVTIAVIDTEEGVTIVSSTDNALRLEQQAML